MPNAAKYSTQIQKIEWSQVKFGTYTEKDCERHLNDLLRLVRTYRVLPEILNDIEFELSKNPLKRPPNAYNLFIKDQKVQNSKEAISDLAKKYRGLSDKQKKKYEDAAQKLRQEFNERMQNF